jgi:ribonucleotide monophosphatase NagD (HAD superfamily)
MVGDTLHTDILGGAQAGWKTVLVTDHGLLRGENVEQAIARSGIVPDYIVATT